MTGLSDEPIAAERLADVPVLEARPAPATPPQLAGWLRAQSVNLARHAAGLRPFHDGEFGRGPGSPAPTHLAAANRLIERLRKNLLRTGRGLSAAGRRAAGRPGFHNLRRFTRLKDRGQRWVKATEKVWDFYRRIFNQRQSRIGAELLAADRLALDCYQVVYSGLGTARSVPSPPPYSFMESGTGPATFRRGVVLTLLGRRANPFPLIKLPYHRLLNPWTLGAVPHEVAHNIQSDLGLWQVLPREILRRLTAAGLDRATARVWARWHKEIFADLCGLLLSGPAFVDSLMSVVGGSPRRTLSYNPGGVHPTPYLRVFINLELLRRLGFRRQAAAFRRTWRRLYPARFAHALPAALLRSFDGAHRRVVQILCFTPYRQLGGKPLVSVVRFGAKEQAMVEEAAGRLAAGTDPGIVPERFLIGAARSALTRRLARPEVIRQNFYNALGRR